MSQEQLRAFLEALKDDGMLQEKINNAGVDLQTPITAAGDANAVVTIARDAGFMLSAEDLDAAQMEMSEDDLAAVAGGFNVITWNPRGEFA